MKESYSPLDPEKYENITLTRKLWLKWIYLPKDVQQAVDYLNNSFNGKEIDSIRMTDDHKQVYVHWVEEKGFGNKWSGSYYWPSKSLGWAIDDDWQLLQVYKVVQHFIEGKEY